MSSSPKDLYLQYSQLRQARLEKQREMETLKEAETAAKRELMGALEGMDGLVANNRVIRLVEKERFFIEQYDFLKEFVLDTGYTHLYSSQLSAPAVREIRTELESDIPGVGVHIQIDLSDKKA